MTESFDLEKKFTQGIEMILTAHEQKILDLSSEIRKLTGELCEKDQKIKKLDELCTCLLKEKKDYETRISSLNIKISKLKTQIDSLDCSKEISFDIKGPKNTSRRNKSTYIEYEQSNTIERVLSDKKRNSVKKEMSQNHQNKKKKINNNEQQSQLFCMSHNSSKNGINREKVNTSRISMKDLSEEDDDNNGDFFKKCRNTMSTNEYNEILEIVKLFNLKKLSKQETYKNIVFKLTQNKYIDLLTEFNKLFM